MYKPYKSFLLILINPKGSSLVLALLVSFMLITLISITLHFSNTELKSAVKYEEKTSAYFIAEAGLERAIYEINQGLKNNGQGLICTFTTEDLQPCSFVKDFGDGTFNVTISTLSNDKYKIVSIGSFEEEHETITKIVGQGSAPPDPSKEPFNFAMYAHQNLNAETVSGILGIGTHPIKVEGNIHGNNQVNLKHLNKLGGIFNGPDPEVKNGMVTSKEPMNIHIEGLHQNLEEDQFKYIPQPEFDFDTAREQAIKGQKEFLPSAFYVDARSGLSLNNTDSLGKLGISLLGLSPELIFIDGDLTVVGLDLLGIALSNNRTIVVNGTFTGTLDVGGNLFQGRNFNLIARDIIFGGAVTGLQVNGVLYAQNNITTSGHVEVDGYIGANNIKLGNNLLDSVLVGLLGPITGAMSFTYDSSVLSNLPPGIEFKKMYVE